MNPIQKDELYENISQFLKNKGIELKEGSYTKGIHAGCSLLADAINLSQTGVERAKTGIERRLDQVRQVIHEKTAPKRPATSPSVEPAPNGKPKATARTKRKATSKKSKRRS
jgi:hypothetical protein